MAKEFIEGRYYRYIGDCSNEDELRSPLDRALVTDRKWWLCTGVDEEGVTLINGELISTFNWRPSQFQEALANYGVKEFVIGRWYRFLASDEILLNHLNYCVAEIADNQWRMCLNALGTSAELAGIGGGNWDWSAVMSFFIELEPAKEHKYKSLVFGLNYGASQRLDELIGQEVYVSDDGHDIFTTKSKDKLERVLTNSYYPFDTPSTRYKYIRAELGQFNAVNGYDGRFICLDGFDSETLKQLIGAECEFSDDQHVWIKGIFDGCNEDFSFFRYKLKTNNANTINYGCARIRLVDGLSESKKADDKKLEAKRALVGKEIVVKINGYSSTKDAYRICGKWLDADTVARRGETFERKSINFE